MKKLIVAEKPSVARDIARVLGVKGRAEGYIDGDDYAVTWALGHLVALCEPDELDEKYKKWRWGDLPIIPEDIPLKVLPKTRSQFSVVKKLMNSKEISSIICATDSAREGELIFRYIYIKAGCKKSVERLWISSMTDQAIKAGFASLKPSSEYDALFTSARCRSEADWIVGMNASRAFSLKYNANLPIGRVQTPTLSMLVERDNEIAAFVPKDYWEVRANFGDYEGVYYDSEAKDTKIFDEEKARAIRAEVAGKTGAVSERSREIKSMPPPQLFDLTTLQREANRKYGYPADKTLKLAQSLYETHKALTYPRTDSRYLSGDMPPKIAQTIKKLPQPYAAMAQTEQFNPNVRSKRYYDDSRISDHHAIVPTDRTADLSRMTQDEKNIYDMVARRLIAIHYPDYKYESAKITTMVGPREFRSSGSVPVLEGWRVLYRDEKKAAVDELPDVNVGDTRKVARATVKAQKTKPPQPHNDASLLGLMENAGAKLEDPELRERMKSAGLGTPATRAAIIERLISAGYAQRKGKTIISTEKGRRLISVTPPQISSPATTGKWEKALYDLANNPDADLRGAKADRFMSGISRFADFLVQAAREANPAVQFERTPPQKKYTRTTTARKKPHDHRPEKTHDHRLGKDHMR